MRVIEPSFEVITPVDTEAILRHIELCGRVCYKSEGNICEGSAERLIKSMLDRGHESPIEHFSISVRVVTDRGVSHEWVRHRIASYSQESTRYCNYAKDKFGGEITFIRPARLFEGTPEYEAWARAMENAEKSYFEMLDMGVTPETARSVLPNSLKTEFICTMNLREWRHFFELRTSPAAHPDMRAVACPLKERFAKLLPVFFAD
ncbi:MAG: FAD-dependent thymidylate synthase [Clostridia bacterium]|nr:FAD-dependent thymidylate synthase [Clostridia bacterium]